MIVIVFRVSDWVGSTEGRAESPLKELRSWD